MEPCDDGIEPGDGHKPRHRGAHSQDERLFAESAIPRLRTAVEELSWLLTRGYAVPSSVKMVGDRHRLHERQSLAVFRASCPDSSLHRRNASRETGRDLRDRDLMIDGFNVLITLEAALSGGVIVRGRDGCLRDIASVHGSYRSVEETDRALDLLRRTLDGLRPRSVTWLLDSPVSNSGRLAARMRMCGEAAAATWTVETVFSPDHVLKTCGTLVATTDGVILDAAQGWLDLARHAIRDHLPGCRIVDLWAAE
jgi:hypothetical protein